MRLLVIYQCLINYHRIWWHKTTICYACGVWGSGIQGPGEVVCVHSALSVSVAGGLSASAAGCGSTRDALALTFPVVPAGCDRDLGWSCQPGHPNVASRPGLGFITAWWLVSRASVERARQKPCQRFSASPETWRVTSTALFVKEITKAGQAWGKEKRLHLLMRVFRVLRGNLAVEILLKPFSKTCQIR